MTNTLSPLPDNRTQIVREFIKSSPPRHRIDSATLVSALDRGVFSRHYGAPDQRRAVFASASRVPRMAIELTRTQIEEALPRIAPSLKSCVWLQEHRDSSDLRYNPVYRKRFNHFYRVRRGTVWQDKFYDLLESKKHQTASFAQVLHALHQATDRWAQEVEFSS